jgi:hypothetical protein
MGIGGGIVTLALEGKQRKLKNKYWLVFSGFNAFAACYFESWSRK